MIVRTAQRQDINGQKPLSHFFTQPDQDDHGQHGSQAFL